jgi:ArsR family transcriptional regulator
MITNNLKVEVNRLHAEICSALADPNRILIIYHLAEHSSNVSDLAAAIGLSQPSTSRHLKTLRERGLVQATRRGASVEYQLIDDRLVKALDILRSILHERITKHATLIENDQTSH